MLEGKVVLITGGSRGIGAASVRAARESGADVILHYGRSEGAARAIAAEESRGGCHLVQSDLAGKDGAARLWDKAITWKGHVDVLVNNAGTYTALELSRPDAQWQAGWEETLQINLASPATLMRRAIPHFRERGGGIIINVESRAAFRGDGPVYAHYAASKAGLMAFGRTVARAHAGEGILVFGIAPGWVQTDMAEAGIAELGLDYVVRDIPIGAIVPPAEIANLIVFLAAGKATHVTGTTIDINGASYPR